MTDEARSVAQYPSAERTTPEKDRVCDNDLGRRDFLRGALVGGAAAAAPTFPEISRAEAQPAPSPAAGYLFLNLA